MKKKEPTLVTIINRYKTKFAVNAIENFTQSVDNNVDTIDPHEKITPLVAAVCIGNPVIVKAILKLGPDISKPKNLSAVTEAIDSVNYHAGLGEDKFLPDKKCDIMRDLHEVMSLVLKYKSLFEKGEPFSGVF